MSERTMVGPDGSAGDDPFKDVPGGPPRPGEPGYEWYRGHPNFLPPYPKVVPDGLEDYRDQLSLGVAKEGDFLAKMWVYAKHYGLHEEYEDLLLRALKLRPDKVLAAAKTMNELGNIYEAVHAQATESWGDIVGQKRWTGDFADEFAEYFPRLIGYASQSGTHTLFTIAKDTSKTFEVFGLALQKWRDDMAAAIKGASQMDRETERKIAEAVASGAYDVSATANPGAQALGILKAMISIWSAIDAEAKKKQEGLQRLARELNVPIRAPEDKYVDELHIQEDELPSGRLV